MTSFDEVAAGFWGAPSEDFPDRPLTDELVAEAERVLEVILPADLLSLLRVRNGGAVAGAWNAHSLGADKYVLFDYLLGIALDPDMPSMLSTPYLIGECRLPSSIVLINGEEGHYWVALDYRECGPAGEPAVVRLENDGARDERLAPDFRTFITGLRPQAEFVESGRSAA